MWKADKTAGSAGAAGEPEGTGRRHGRVREPGGFLEHVSLVMDNAEASGTEMVSVMTLHGAKGLEFDYVFLPGWEDGLFPNQRSMDDTGIAGLEEERRLAYVGLTRARLRAHVSHAANRRMHGSWVTSIPSRFVSELPESHIETRSGGRSFVGAPAWVRRQALAVANSGAAASAAGSHPGRSGRLRDR